MATAVAQLLPRLLVGGERAMVDLDEHLSADGHCPTWWRGLLAS
jgi:hypothetical protein